MNFSGRIIEEWLLSGKAVYKNLSVGNAGLTQIPVPEGKTFIITKISILPFANIIDPLNNIAEPETFYTVTNGNQNLARINDRSTYQLVFWNERVNNTWNLRNRFALNMIKVTGGEETAPSNYYDKQEIDTFMIVESNSWLYLKYIDFVSTIATVSVDTYNNIFNGNQNWLPNEPFGYSDQADIYNVASPAGPSFDYTPQGLDTTVSTPDFNNNQYVLPAFNTTLDPTQQSSFIPPNAASTSGPINSNWYNSIPLYNIEYIEINRRLSTTGLL